MVKWVIATWAAVLPWYLATGATSGPSGPLGLAGPLGLVGFHLVSAAFTVAGAWFAWRWRRAAWGRVSGVLLAILIGLLLVASAAHVALGIVSIATGADATTFASAAWRAGALVAMLSSLSMFLVLTLMTVVSAVAMRRRATLQ